MSGPNVSIASGKVAGGDGGGKSKTKSKSKLSLSEPSAAKKAKIS